MSMKIDFSDFDKGFETIVKDLVPEEAEKALFQAGNAVLRDAIYERPFAPFKEGHLRGAAIVEKAKKESKGIETEFGFNIEYAARWHELSPAEDARINWTLPGSGRKYLEQKMVRNKDRYMKLIADIIGRIFRGRK